MLTPDEVSKVATELWRKQAAELPTLEKVRGYMRGELGRPSLPDSPSDELRELSKLSVKNIMPLVVDAFTSAMTVTGFRSPSAEDDAAVWAIWQRERMDARQNEVHRPMVTYGASYLMLDSESGKVRFNPRSPRRMFAAYVEPERDLWPQYALDTTVERDGKQRKRTGWLLDAEAMYPVMARGSSATASVVFDDSRETKPHPFKVCPVVRFVNVRDVEDMLTGEVEPLIDDQKTLNAINFDRLVVSRFGAFPQKYVMGWTPEDSAVAAKMSAMRIITFEDSEVKAGSFTAASITGYNELIAEQQAYIATKARVAVHSFTGNLSNVGSETIALVDSPNQRKAALKRVSAGESWEQVLRKAAEVERADIPDDAEVIWDRTEAWSLAQVVDAIAKLDAAGIPAELMLDLVPGLSQQKVDALIEGARRGQAESVALAVVNAARGGGQALIAAEGAGTPDGNLG